MKKLIMWKIEICPMCGKSFERHTSQKYCSIKCRRKAEWLREKSNLPVRKCEICGKSFKPKSRGVKYCSVKCQKQTQAEKICETCGKIFRPRPNVAKKQRFCSRKCQRYKVKCIVCGKEFASYSTEKKYCSEECRHKGQAEKICVVCGKVFKPRISDKQKFCGAVCETKFHNAYNRIYSSEHRTRKDYAEKNCAICGKIFKPRSYKQITCGSLKCRQKNGEANRIKRLSKNRKCIVCGKKYEGARKTCSDDCLKKFTIGLRNWTFQGSKKNGKKKN